MKVTIVSDAVYPWHTGGKEVRYHQLAQGLAARGHDLEIATMHWWGNGEPEGPRHRALVRRVEMYANGKRSMRQGILFALACFRLLRDDSDVIEADHMPYLQLFPLWLVAKIRRVPLTVTWHEYWGRDGWREYLGGPAGGLAALIEKTATRLPTHIFAVSEATAAALRDAGVAAERITLAENGVAAHAPERPRTGMSAVGRLIKHKRFDIAILAVAELKRAGRAETLHVVGDGPERENLEKLAVDAGVEELVRFHGIVESQEELWDLVAGTRVLLAPSEREGYGLAVAEALQLGTPVVVSDHRENAAKNLVNTGNGRIAAAGDAAEFARAATEVVGLDSATVRAASVGVLANWSAMVDRYEEVYTTLVPTETPDTPSPGQVNSPQSPAAPSGASSGLPAANQTPIQNPTEHPIRLSVVVCSYNGAKRIAQTLHALKNQRTSTRWELLVVDDGSRDDTAAIARALGVEVVSDGVNRGLSAARNAGIIASRGEIVAFTDDDVVPSANWVEGMLQAWNTAGSHVTGLGGTTRALAVDSLARRYVSVNNPLAPLEQGIGRGGVVRRLLQYLRQPDPPSHRRTVSSLVGANMSFRREALDAVEGFDPVIRFGGDEEDLCRRLRDAYGEDTLEVEPSLVVDHDFDSTLKDTLRRSRAYGKGNGRDWARRGGVPALRPLPVLCTLLGVLALFAPVFVVAAAVLPFVVYRKVLRRGFINYGKEALLYPCVGLLQEVFAVTGFAEEVWRQRHGHSGNGVGAVTTSNKPRHRTRISLFALLASTSVAAMLLPTHWLIQAAAVLGVVLLPGAAISHVIGTDRSGRAGSLLLATGYGVALLMVLGWFSSMLLKGAAFARPTQIGAYVAIFLVACTFEHRRGTDILTGIIGRRPGRALTGFAAALVLPLATLVAVERLDHGNGNGAALTVFLLAAAVLVATVATGISVRGARHAGGVLLGLYSAALSVVWGTASRGEHLYGWDIQKEFSVATETATRGFWQAPADQDAYASMLSITSLPAQLRALAGVSAEGTLTLLFPMLLVLLPVALFELVRRHASVRAATVVTAGYVIAARTFPGQMPAIGRQEVALMLFAAGLLLASDRTVAARSRRLGTVILLGATAFSHYTTAYVTLLMVVAAASATWFATRSDRDERNRVTFDRRTVAAIAMVILGWNLVVAPTASLIEETRQEVESDGLRVLPGQIGEDRGLVQVWLEGGSVVRYGTPDDYARELSMLRENRLAWMDVDVYLGEVEPVRTRAPDVDGIFGDQRGPWNVAAIMASQLMLLVLTVGTLRVVIRRRWKSDGLPVDLLGMVVGAFALSVLLRISGSAADFYNPERGALHGALVLGVPAAILLDRLALRYVRTFAASAVVAMVFAAGTWGVASYLVGGSPPASTSAYGEDNERFLVSKAELSTAHWLATELDADDLLQGDRYAQVVLLSLDRQSEYGKVFIMHPDFVDYGAYIVATRTNVVEGRARGYQNRQFAIFTSPIEGFALLRATVYATEETSVLK